jgi:hypothetical protein
MLDLMVDLRVLVSSPSNPLTMLATPFSNSTDMIGKVGHLRFGKIDSLVPVAQVSVAEVVASVAGEVALAEASAVVGEVLSWVAAVVLLVGQDLAVVAVALEEDMGDLQPLDLRMRLLPLPIPSQTTQLPALREAR